MRDIQLKDENKDENTKGLKDVLCWLVMFTLSIKFFLQQKNITI